VDAEEHVAADEAGGAAEHQLAVRVRHDLDE
jgi:hypothetical protein